MCVKISYIVQFEQDLNEKLWCWKWLMNVICECMINFLKRDIKLHIVDTVYTNIRLCIGYFTITL